MNSHAIRLRHTEITPASIIQSLIVLLFGILLWAFVNNVTPPEVDCDIPTPQVTPIPEATVQKSTQVTTGVQEVMSDIEYEVYEMTPEDLEENIIGTHLSYWL